jgi:hypothetical protein
MKSIIKSVPKASPSHQIGETGIITEEGRDSFLEF